MAKTTDGHVKTAKESREERLAAALRANLRRRKAAMRTPDTRKPGKE